MKLTTRSLTNGKIRIDYLTDAGPRIIRFSSEPGGKNLFAELPGAGWETPYGQFNLFGGHRLWHAPEAFPRTSLPDNDTPRIEEFSGGVRLSDGKPSPAGISKSIALRLDPVEPIATVEHTLKNDNLWEVELAPWGITQCALGGVAVLPQEPPNPDLSLLLPNRKIIFWPYTRYSDPRLELHDDLVLVRGDPQMPPVKIGSPNPHGWLAYISPAGMFVKRFAFDPSGMYPDHGCNAEIYCNAYFIEVETLGPLTRLAPGASISHVETWELHPVNAGLFAGAPPVEVIRELTLNLSR